MSLESVQNANDLNRRRGWIIPDEIVPERGPLQNHTGSGYVQGRSCTAPGRGGAGDQVMGMSIWVIRSEAGVVRGSLT
jgi:hypothetical protein